MRKVNSPVHYYSDDLTKKLNYVAEVRTTLIEAPLGYGKTTAIKDLMQSKEAQGIRVEWIAVAEEPEGAFCNRFFSALKRVDESGADYSELDGIENPLNQCRGKILDLLSGIRCERETFLVIDQMELIQEYIPEEIFRALIAHGGDKLHLVLITDRMFHAYAAFLGNAEVYQLRTKDFCLDAADIIKFYRSNDLQIEAEEAVSIAEYTQGWAVAVYLQMLSYKKTGRVQNYGAAALLMENQVWDRLNETEREILLLFAGFRQVTLKLALFMTENITTLDEMRTLFEKIPFVTKTDGGRKFEIHQILCELLEEKMQEKEASYRRSLSIKRGDWYLAEGDELEALWQYYSNQCYGHILKIDLGSLVFQNVHGVSVLQIIEETAMNYAPADGKREIISLLRIARILVFMGNRPLYRSMMEQIKTLIECQESADMKRHLQGEWHLIYALSYFPRPDRMQKEYLEAGNLIAGRSKVMTAKDSFLFGGPLQILDLHAGSENLDEMIDLAENCISVYSGLTGGGGRGMETLLRAELALMRGTFDEASILAYKAGFQAKEADQKGIMLNAEFVILICMVCMGDEEGFHKTYERVLKAKEDAKHSAELQYAAQFIEGCLALSLDRHAAISFDRPQERVPVTFLSMQHFRDFMILYYKKEYLQLIGSAQLAASRAQEHGKRMLAVIYRCIITAAYNRIGNWKLAAEQLLMALEMAEKERILFPFVSMWGGFSELLDREELVEEFHKYHEFLDHAKELSKVILKGRKQIQKEEVQYQVASVLAKREQDIAQLAAKGHSNLQIAEELYLSVNTVKMHLKSIFRKLEIEKRSELSKFFQQ